MKDTSFLFAAEKFDRLVSSYRRQPDGKLKEDPRTQPAFRPRITTAAAVCSRPRTDYVRFTQMILRKGRAERREQILQPQNRGADVGESDRLDLRREAQVLRPPRYDRPRRRPRQPSSLTDSCSTRRFPVGRPPEL